MPPRLLLLGGAVGKSAQLPLQTWLPDAMAGPTPVSALIHAATMVTAGVYLIARTHVLFDLAPPRQLARVAVIGAATLLLAGCQRARRRRDIKRILAYSTMSQIGYMFLALGRGRVVGGDLPLHDPRLLQGAARSWRAGVVILALHHEHDMFKMGGLRKELPLAFWTFLIGGCALAGPAARDRRILQQGPDPLAAWSAQGGHPAFWIAGLVGVLIDVALHLPPGLPCLLRPTGTPVTKPARLCMIVPGHVWPCSRSWPGI